MRATWSWPLTSPHPAATGGLEIGLDITDDVVTAAAPQPGRVHRGAEKLFESRDYRAALSLANRHDWTASYASELGLAQVVEHMLGLPVPERAQWLRVLLAEYTRIHHHLLWLAASATELQLDVAALGHAATNELADVLARWTGTRMHTMVVRYGGLHHDPGAVWVTQAVDMAERAADVASIVAQELATDPRTQGVAVLRTSDARAWATSGPVARASGAPMDLRASAAGPDPYAQLAAAGVFRPVLLSTGDAATRFAVLGAETAVSAACVAAVGRRLAQLDGPVSVALPKVLRVPEGVGFAEVESATGRSGWYLESRGDPTPYRLAMRTASFANAMSLQSALVGTRVSDLRIALASYFLVAGDTDK